MVDELSFVFLFCLGVFCFSGVSLHSPPPHRFMVLLMEWVLSGQGQGDRGYPPQLEQAHMKGTPGKGMIQGDPHSQ